MIKGSLFIWLYRAFGIAELVSFPTLFLAIGIEVVVFIIVAIIAFIAARNTLQKVQEQLDNYRNTYDEDGYEYYE